MKKTWKFTLAAVAICTSLGGSLIAQTDDGVVVLGHSARRGQSPGNVNTEGAVRLGGAPALTTQSTEGVVPVDGTMDSYPPTIEPSGVDYGPYPVETVGPSGYGEFGPAGEVGYAVSDDPRDILFRAGYRGGDIYGVNHGFTNLSAFVPHYTEADSALWFFNPRLVITDEGRGAANVGFGHRAYAHDLDRVFSFSTWYDYDTGHEEDYHQLGGSFASIGRNLTFRANANFVVSEKTNVVGSAPIGDARLDNTTGMLLQDFNQFTEVAYNQADFEVSTPMPLLGRYGFEWGAGAYWLFGTDAPDATGAKARIEAQLTEDLWVNAIVSNDRAFDTNASVNFEFTIPNAPASRYFKPNKVRDSLLASDRRFYRVATDIVTRRASMPVMMNGGTGGAQALRLAIIDPNVTDDPALAFGGSGTEDDPFRSLLDFTEESDDLKSSFSLIYVRRRADDTSLNLDTTITLFDNQALLGEGIAHSLANLGSISLPGSTDGLFVPTLTNEQRTGMPVVTLANANQVAGFNIDGTGTGPGIVGTNIDGFSINNVNMTNVTEGIRIISDTAGGVGTNLGIIRDNMIAGIGLGSAKGVTIDHRAGTLGLAIQDNTITAFQGEDANQNGVLDPSEDTNMNGQLDPGEDLNFDGMLDVAEDLDMDGILDAGFGIEVVASGSSTILANDPTGALERGIANNNILNSGTGISVRALDSSSIALDFENNTASGSTDLIGAGFEVLADGGSIGISTFVNNTATSGAGAGAIFQTLNGGTIAVSNPVVNAFDLNTFTGNALDGMFVEADSGSIMFDQIANSVFNNNGDDGLDLQTTNGGVLGVRDTLAGNTYDGNGDNGIEVTGGIGGMLSVDIGDPLITDASPVSGNGGAGIFLGVEGGTLMASFSGLTATNNTGSGAIISLDGGSIFLDGISNNSFTNNGRHGLEIINNNGGTLVTPFVSDNDFSNNAEAGLFIGGSGPIPGSGVATTALTDLGSVTRNNFNRDVSGTDGIQFDANDQRIMATLTRNTFVGRAPVVDETGVITTEGAGRGIGGRVGGSSTGPGGNGGLTLTVGTPVAADANTFSLNGDAHIGILMEGNTTNSIDAVSSRFMGAFNGGFQVGDNPATASDSTPLFSGDGVHYIVADTATLTGSVVDSRLSGNENNGLEIEISGNNDAGNSAMTPAAQVNGFVIADNVFGLDPSLPETDPDFALNTGNGADGIAVFRNERGQFNDMVIADNLINANSRNGILISSAGVDQLDLPNMRPDSVSIVGNTITNNVSGDGIEFRIGADADLLANLDMNVIDNNGLNGVQVAKFINDAKDSRSITGVWTRNTVRNNGDDGLDLEGLLGNILNDPISGSMTPIAGAGTFPRYGLVIGDVAINPVGFYSPMGNIITGNAADGVQVTGGGLVTIGNNEITGNGTLSTLAGPLSAIHAGIRVEGAEFDNGNIQLTGTTDTTVDDFVDAPSFQEVLAFSNLISFNNGDGVQFLVEGGSPSFDFADFTGDPMVPQTPPFDDLDTQTLRLINNEITRNEGRGVDILARPGDNDSFDSDNIDPDGTPQNVLNSVLGTVTMIGNHVKDNAWEGIYIVTTADEDTNQVEESQVDPGGTVDGIDGAVGAESRLNIEMHANEVIGNGGDVTNFPATGLVVRVGTNGPLYGPFFPGGFATDGFNPEDLDGDGVLDNDLDGDGYLDSVEPVFGGIAMTMTENYFNGNFGDDILFHSFRSTVDPITTEGEWTGPTFDDMGMLTEPGEFTIDAYQGDPLARLDLIFTNNTFHSIEANNQDSTVGTFGQPGAYYDNAEGVFKSRLFDGMATAPGPFSDEARGRNAQRLASRYLTGDILLPDPLISPDNGLFLYPGMGNSTFRVRGSGNAFRSSSLGAVALSDIFIFDDPTLVGDPLLVDSIFEANGVLFGAPPPSTSGLPWGWGDLVPIPALPPVIAP